MADKNAADAFYNTPTEAEAAVKSLQKGGFDMKKLSIMVVDDQPDILDIAKTILERSGHVVQTADSGMKVFSLLEEKKPDLIILDVVMPHMDGLEVLERLKGTAETSSIPVILLTAKVQKENMLRGYKLGADYYIPKPFNSAQLFNGINFVLSGDQKHSNQPDLFFKA